MHLGFAVKEGFGKFIKKCIWVSCGGVVLGVAIRRGLECVEEEMDGGD